MARGFIKPDGSNPYGLRITEYHRRLAAVKPEEVEYWAGPGLEQAKDVFSNISQNTVLTENGRTYRGGQNPFIFSTSLKTDAALKSGIPELEKFNQIVHYQAPSDSSGIEGCNTCGFETGGCSSACFAHGGQMGLAQGRVAQLSRTQMGFENPAMFLGLGLSEIRGHVKRSLKQGLTPVYRWGGTNEDLLHLMEAGQPFAETGALSTVYTKAQARDLVDPKQLIENPYPKTHTLVQSVTEHTTIPRMLQASQDQGMALAVPTTRAPHARYTPVARMVDKQGRRADFPALLTPSTLDAGGHGESLGDTSDARHMDRALSGIEGGVLWLGGKRSRYVDAQGINRHEVIGKPFIREVDPSRQIISFQERGIWRPTEEEIDTAVAEGTAERVSSRPTPVSIRPSRSGAFRGE